MNADLVSNRTNRLLRVSSTDPEDARRRRLLNILLLGVGFIAFLAMVGTAITYLLRLTSLYNTLFLVGMAFGLSLGLLLIFIVNRYGSGWLASSLFVLLLTMVFAFSDEPRQVVEGRSVFLFTIPILMASVILRPWASFALAGLSSVTISILALRLPEYVPPLPTMLGFFAFALVAWLSARSLESALQDLRAINRELDQRVADRTKELRKANRQLAEANERLMELDRLKSRFVSMVSHELRTPLGAVQGFAEMLKAGVYGSLSDKQRSALERIETNTKTLLLIVNDLLDQARIEAGQLSLHPAPFPPAELAEDLRFTLGVLAEKKGLELTTLVEPDVPETLYGDKERLNQILLNLVSNGIKFTEKGGIHVRMYLPASSQSPQWAIDVVDTGPGISREDQGAIFVPFRRVDDLVTREHTGVGLGLSIVRHLVELMDGSITLESKLGHGSTFTIVLPLQPTYREDS
jgi:signal transduction histidine kinase